ncbi:MAG: class I SAM-dependent methyltransferase, partial [Chloroflexi bacterium]
MGSGLYDVTGFKAGKSRLKPVEREELTGVQGKSLLHIQCHFGLDTLSWAREGAIVTGVDFSEPALEAARGLADECGIEARFIHSDVYSVPQKLSEQFDIVFTSYGALCWLPDMHRWAEIVARFLKPGGTFYMVEFHPMSGVFADGPEA